MSNEETTQATETDNTDAATETEGATTEQGSETVETETGESTEKDATGENAEKEAQVPESYEKFALPEGMPEMQEDTFNTLTEGFKELGLSQEQGQKAVDLHMKIEQARAEAQEKIVAQWADDSKHDKEIGGEDFDKNLKLANRVVAKFARPLKDDKGEPVVDSNGVPQTDLSKILNDSGFGNHPAMIRAWVEIGKALSEDTLAHSGDSVTKREKTAAEKLFPTMAHNQ